MIKAVFFDLYFTLVKYEPSQEEIEADMLHKFGIDVSAERLRGPLAQANDTIYKELVDRPLSQRSKEDTMALYARFHRNILKGAGLEAGENVIMGLLAGQFQAKMKLALFDDVLPALDDLKKRGLTVGLISNIERSMSGALDELGLSSKLDVIVTSLDAGANKPQPEIFRYAMKKVNVTPAQSIYIGDQYLVDVIGAKSAGMKGILLDRDSRHEEIADSPRIKSLSEVTAYL
jgi:putative hydrolase of the HAD superfamily